MKLLRYSILLSLLLIPWDVTHSQTSLEEDDLRAGFLHPSTSSRPLVWWHWMNGNISKEGIRLDLDWMHRIGLAGFQTFDASFLTPQLVRQRVVYMSPEWRDAFKEAVSIGSQHNMEMAIAASPGWSETGGPWVSAEDGMKKYVWSETEIEGGKHFQGRLRHPPEATGAYQDMGVRDFLGGMAEGEPRAQLYADTRVIAYRKAASDVSFGSLQPTTTFSGGAPEAGILTDGEYARSTGLPIPPVGDSAWIQVEFPAPALIQAATFAMYGPTREETYLYHIGTPDKVLEASDDGKTWTLVSKFDSHFQVETISFPAVVAKYFRLRLQHTPAPPPLPWMNSIEHKPHPQGPPTVYNVAEFQLYPGARVNHLQEKSGFSTAAGLESFPNPAVHAADEVDPSEVVDLTARMQKDGTLDWDPPPGHWVVLRFGYSLLGITNNPAAPEATGLEVDKLDRAAVEKYANQYLALYQGFLSQDSTLKSGISYVVSDSWEAGSQNWTLKFLEDFKRLRGYDAVPWMPVLAGVIVKSAADSDKFLWDYRKTISELIANEHYAMLEHVLHQHGLGYYAESHESGRAFIGDGMEVKKYSDVPMGAMWTQMPGTYETQFGFNADDRETSSVAHIYGKRFAAAESLTAAGGPWAWTPASLKPIVDIEFLNGINRLAIHESAHQALIDKAPGITLGPFGQWFNRNETWAEEAGPWVDYMSRTSYLLQQGLYVGDVLCYYGEDSNLTAIYAHSAPAIPPGYNFDYVNADALIHNLRVDENGNIQTPGGTSYRVLDLEPASRNMSLPVLEAIHELVLHGATVVGPKPVDDPSLADDKQVFLTLSEELFGDGSGLHRVGKGAVLAGSSVADGLERVSNVPDFEVLDGRLSTPLRFIHRHLADADLYFVVNQSNSVTSARARFRVHGKQAELWRSESGVTQAASYSQDNHGTTVQLDLEPWESLFVVFMQNAVVDSREIAPPRQIAACTLTGPWTISFQPGRGAPAGEIATDLSPWNESKETGIRYFSGKARYETSFAFAPERGTDRHKVWLDLGEVGDLAKVIMNGRDLGVVWHRPYRVDVTSALRSGTNRLAVEVINTWENRLIGDEQPGSAHYTFTDIRPFREDTPLHRSGLQGPVQILTTTE